MNVHAHTQAQQAPRSSALGTRCCSCHLAGAEPPAPVSARLLRERIAVGAAATLLGDTTVRHRSSYIHPAWIDAGRSDLVTVRSRASGRVGTNAVARFSTDPEAGPRSFPDSRYRLKSCAARLRSWPIELRQITAIS